MTEPQKEYIITEDERIRAIKFLVLHGMSPLESRPYKSSDKVLDELNQKIEDYQKNKPKLATCAVIILSLVQIWIEELRTKERERMRKEMTR